METVPNNGRQRQRTTHPYWLLSPCSGFFPFTALFSTFNVEIAILISCYLTYFRASSKENNEQHSCGITICFSVYLYETCNQWQRASQQSHIEAYTSSMQLYSCIHSGMLKHTYIPGRVLQFFRNSRKRFFYGTTHNKYSYISL